MQRVLSAAMGAILCGIAHIAWADHCPDRPSDARINATFERIRSAGQASPGAELGHEVVDFVTAGDHCGLSFVHYRVYWEHENLLHVLPYGFNSRGGVAQLTLADDGWWRLIISNGAYVVRP
jgi:hypothetical protein